MPTEAHLTTTLERMTQGLPCTIACLGGSLTVGSSPGAYAKKPWRKRFIKYLREGFAPRYESGVTEARAAIGAMKSYGAVFTLDRNVVSSGASLVFIEFSVNDRTSPDKDLVKKSMEGIIRKLRKASSQPDIVLLGAGVRPGTGDNSDGLIDHTIHRNLADHYNVPFLDIQQYLLSELKNRGQTWDDVRVAEGDDIHLNEYGNEIWFNHMREWFDEQYKAYSADPSRKRDKRMPEPLYSDEFEGASLLNPTVSDERIVLEGSWEPAGEDINRPWHIDDLLVGRPGDKLTFTFKGSAIGTICRAYPNGLKLHATLDGESIAGPFTNYKDPFTNYDILRHGMPEDTHTLELVVGKPLRRLNMEPDPQARIGFLLFASKDNRQG